MTAPFDHLLASHYLRVHRAALGYMGEEQAAREAAHDALLKAHRARERYDPARPFYPWLRRIVRNTCFDALARRATRGSTGMDPERISSPSPSAEQLVARDEEARRLHRTMRTLSEAHQEILRLRHFEDLSYAELAEVLELAEGTVMSRLYRARRALAGLMETT